jgi:hypothetical protein
VAVCRGLARDKVAKADFLGAQQLVVEAGRVVAELGDVGETALGDLVGSAGLVVLEPGFT